MPVAWDGRYYENNEVVRDATAEEYAQYRSQYPQTSVPEWARQGYTTRTSWETINRDRARGDMPSQILTREQDEQHRLLRTWFSQQRQRQQGNQAERGSAGGAGGTGVSSRPQMAPGGTLGGTSLLGG